LFAIDDQNPFPDVALQQRYQMLIGEVRCLVCQNLPIADSDAPLAQDLRREIHGMVEAGQSDDQIVAFLVSRYGDSILYRPPVQANTLPLWAAPFVLLAIGLIVFAWIVRQRAGEPRGLDR
jgi:cytochrome c-type biogenesis protein CcmH